jgi:photosystem II stability/assembly factor-like uncharacterized protein
MLKRFSVNRIFCVLFGIFILNSAAYGQGNWTLAQKAATSGDLNAVFFADSETGWVGGDSGFLARTTDGGENWSRQIIDTQDAVNDIYFRGSEKGYVLAGDHVFSTTDGGSNWREEKILRAEDFKRAKPELYSIRFADKRNGWIVGSVSEGDRVVESLVLHSSDGGALWRRVRVPTAEELIHLDFVNDENGWIVGAGGTILSTNDGGATWRKQISATRATIYHVDFKNSDNGWAVGEKGLILRTVDGGSSWEKIASNATKTLLSVEFVNDKNGWIVGRGGTVLLSNDGGRTWVKQEGKTGENLFALFMAKKQGWAVGGKGTIVRYNR